MAVIREAHRFMGFGIVGGWTLLLLLGVVLALRKRDAGRVYWGLLTVLQALLGAQLVAGIVLLVSGGRPPLLHYFYGVVFPGVVLVLAHLLTRALTKGPYHVFFTVAAFFNAALTARALQTGLGM